ncbi:uncharacterized protein G2W53_012203 [Senna tora]|uniref:Uncharacterized protein n=1 Tax=Senna tora TaxID=362788 RepID=A0A834U134_9FABA|nr:uncharacterized protein G2W53_012203 [Senna tora]
MGLVWQYGVWYGVGKQLGAYRPPSAQA